MSSKLDYLRKYAGAPKNSKATLQSRKTRQKERKGGVAMIDQDIDVVGGAEQEEEDIPVVVEDPDGLLKGLSSHKAFSKSAWVTLEEGQQQQEQPAPVPKRERHDSGSGDEIDIKNDQVESLKIDAGNICNLTLEIGGDIEPPRPKVKKSDRGIIEDVTEKDLQATTSAPTQTVYRQRGGKIISKEKAQESKKDELQRLNAEQLDRWGKGARQLKEEKEQAEYEERQKSKPFARHELDKETDEELKKTERFGDPMKDLVAEPGVKAPGAIMMKCKFKAPPNRYGIEPGHRWDGVDRGNGYEGRLMLTQNERTANEAEAYKWRTEEM